jgi:hypothetical protein
MAPHPTTTQRGLGYQHQQRRKHLLPHAYGTPCPMCGDIMEHGDLLDLDHTIPRALGGTVGDRIVHRTCNRAAGGRLRHTLHPPQTAPLPTSRAW